MKTVLIVLAFIVFWLLVFVVLVLVANYSSVLDRSADETHYYNGIYDSCIVIASKLSGGMYTRENAKWCAELTENARRANAFENRVPEPTGGGIDL